jgi:hypothetical protein
MTTPTQAAKPKPFYKWTTHDKRAANLIGVPCILIAEKDFAALTEALKRIERRAFNEEPCEELEDAQRDLRVIYSTARAALASVEPT